MSATRRVYDAETSAPQRQYACVPGWPRTREELIKEQLLLATRVGGVFVCFPRGKSGAGQTGDPAWAAARVGEETVVVQGHVGAPYEPECLRCAGRPVRGSRTGAAGTADVLLVDATGQDHPRRAGLAFHFGAVLDLPTVGVTHRPLAAEGEWPEDECRARSPLMLKDELVGYWLRTRAAHAHRPSTPRGERQQPRPRRSSSRRAEHAIPSRSAESAAEPARPAQLWNEETSTPAKASDCFAPTALTVWRKVLGLCVQTMEQHLVPKSQTFREEALELGTFRGLRWSSEGRSG